jgi:hypothetical protein
MVSFRSRARITLEIQRILILLKNNLLAVTLMFSLALSACGGGSGKTTNSTEQSPPTTPAPIPTPAPTPAPAASSGTPTYVNGSTAADSTGTAMSLTIHYSPTAGNTVVIAVAIATGTDSVGAVTATDNGSSQYLEGQPFNGGSGNTLVSLLYTTPGGVKSGVSTITVALRQPSKAVAVLGEYSGVAAFGLGSVYFDTDGPTTKPFQTATIGDNNDMMVMAVNSIGTGGVSPNAGNLRNSAVTSGESATSNVSGALVDISATSTRDSVTLAVNTDTSQDWLTSVLELKGTSPLSEGGRLVQATTAFYQANDSNGAVWAVFQKPTTAGNLVVVSLVFTGNNSPPVIKDYLNTWTQAGNTLATGSGYVQMWYALDSISTSYVINYFASPQTPARAEIYEAEYSVPSGTTLEASSAASATSTALDSGAVVTTGSDLLLGFGTDGNLADKLTAGTGFTRRIQDSAYPSDLFEDQMVGAAGSYDGLITDSASSTSGIIVSAFHLGP